MRFDVWRATCAIWHTFQSVSVWSHSATRLDMARWSGGDPLPSGASVPSFFQLQGLHVPARSSFFKDTVSSRLRLASCTMKKRRLSPSLQVSKSLLMDDATMPVTLRACTLLRITDIRSSHLSH